MVGRSDGLQLLLLQLLHLILLQVTLLIRGALKGAPSGGRRAEGRGQTTKGKGGRRTADGRQTEVFTPF